MSQELREDQKLKRLVRVYGVPGYTEVTITAEGITFKAKGTKVGTSANWTWLAEHSHTPENVPSIYADRPVEFLQHQADMQIRRRAKREAKLENKTC
jgi:hypothetical protein